MEPFLLANRRSGFCRGGLASMGNCEFVILQHMMSGTYTSKKERDFTCPRILAILFPEIAQLIRYL